MSASNFSKAGFSIEWIDKETLMYRENGRSVQVWVDFEPGLFSNGRIIRTSSLSRWNTFTDGLPDAIDPDKLREIVARVEEYYRSQRIKCRVEP